MKPYNQVVPKSYKSWQVVLVVSNQLKLTELTCHSGELKLAFTNPDVISTSPKNFLTSRTDFTVLLLFEFLKKTSLSLARRVSEKQNSLAR